MDRALKIANERDGRAWFKAWGTCHVKTEDRKPGVLNKHNLNLKRGPVNTIKGVDLFCGAGGTSQGLLDACGASGLELELIAINHWDIAIETHSINHAYARHLCQNVDAVNPRAVVPGGRLNIMVASPECTHHSIARGGRPINDQSRTSAWHILRWAESLYIENILIENVKEFRQWGPLGANMRPIKRLRGQLYLQFLNSLRALGYTVEDRILNAADYGDPTTRERLFIIARRGRRKITWPKPSHAKDPRNNLFGNDIKPWRAAKEIIDWNLKGQSIFDRKKKLAPNTIARIAAGLKKFGGANAEPFLVMLYGTGASRSVKRPLPTVTANGNHMALCEPFIVPQFSQHPPRSVEKPLGTITTTSRGIALIEPFIVPFFGESKTQKPRIHSVHDPLPTVTSHGAGALVEPFVLQQQSGGAPRSTDDPLPTIATDGAIALVEPYLVTTNHGEGADRRTHSVKAPIPTVTTKNGLGLVEPCLVKYNGTAKARPCIEPMDTVTTKDRFALVEPQSYKPDIRFRMLQPYELARAMSFPDSYKFAGNRALQTKQIGNAVCVKLAQALCTSLLES